MSSTLILRCPVCSTSLEQQDKKLVCENQHNFDRARQGYYNLLLNQHKKSKAPGDNAEMVLARSAFLNGGYYQSISDTINQFAVDQLWQTGRSEGSRSEGSRSEGSRSEQSHANSGKANIVDMGCGEGYYTHRLQEALSDHQIDADVYGLDISKDAIKAAAKRNKDVTWLVANANKPPFEDSRAHLILNVFNRIMPEALAKLCHAKGRLLVASAGAYHLQQLKEAIYDTPRYSEFDCKSALAEHFDHSHRTELDFPIKLDQAGVKALLGMTPHVWRSSPQTQAKLNALDELELRVQVNLDLFMKK